MIISSDSLDSQTISLKLSSVKISLALFKTLGSHFLSLNILHMLLNCLLV